MAKKFHVDARSKGIIKAGVNPKGLQQWKTSEDPRAIRQGISKPKGVEIAPEAKAKPKKQKKQKEEKGLFPQVVVVQLFLVGDFN